MLRRPDGESTPALVNGGLSLLTYVRDTFPEVLGSQASRDLRDEVLIANGLLGIEFPADTFAPRITKVKPESNTGPRPHIRARLNDGSIAESQFDVQSYELSLDGVSVKGQTEVLSRTVRKAKAGKANKVFQKTKLRYRPAQPLSPGVHTAHLKVADLAGNVSERTWNFTVRTKDRDDQDDEGGDDRCDLEPDDSDD